ncbi:unnamed protein product [Leptosia nina]|uniref:Carboxylesterase type B domain-containing protein n=1 Tax=Leptosia nina TaxID=320188 RepID=A0AAV1JCR0_9NEOP
MHKLVSKQYGMDNLPEGERCVVETQNGTICGYIDKRDEGVYYKFKGIPYAEPPLDKLRFMPPIPIKPWKNTLDCTKDAPLPLSIYVDQEVQGSEDCLYLEVSSPNIKPNKPLPVMFWIGSCNFTFYIDHILDPTPLNNGDIVFVRCGFRLGPFGFLSINEFTAPGNVGLKDLILALKWIQNNISKFGGDPNNVTAFGSSTGGIEKSDKFEIVEEMRKLPAQYLMETYTTWFINKYKWDNDVFDSVFKPCIESEFEGQPVFLCKSPAIILKSGNFNKVPIMIGSNNVEAFVFQFIKDNFYEDYEKYNENIRLLVPKSLANVNSDSLKKIGQQILSFYFNSAEGLNEHTRVQYLQFLTDYYFLYYVNKTVQIHSQVAPDCPIYYYVLYYAGEWFVPKELGFFNSIGHAAEVPFIFQIKAKDSKFYKGSCDSLTTRDRFVKMWTNFAKYGNPTPNDDDELLQITWDPVESEKKLNFLSIGSDLTKGRNPFRKRMAFWDNLHQEHIILKIITHMSDMGLRF